MMWMSLKGDIESTTKEGNLILWYGLKFTQSLRI